MRTLTRLGIAGGTVTVMAASVLTSGIGTAGATGPVPLNAKLRNCDFSLSNSNAIAVQAVSTGRGVTQFRTSGSSVVAEVQMHIPDRQGVHYDVGLIQAPRPSSATCGPGDPGTTFSGMDVDPGGNATVALQAPLRQGTTGVWVMVLSADPHSQQPAEFYASEFLAPV